MLKKEISLQKEFDVLTKNTLLLFYQFNNVSTSKWQLLKNEVQKEEKVDHLIFQNKTAAVAIALVLKKLQQLEQYSLSPLSSNTKSEKMLISPESLMLLASQHKLPLPSNYYEVVDPEQPLLEKKELAKSNRKSIDKKVKNLLQGPTFVLGCKTKEDLAFIHKLLQNFSNFLFIGGIYNNQFITHHSVEKLFTLDDSIKIECIQFLDSKKNSSLFFALQKQNLYFLLTQLMARDS